MFSTGITHSVYRKSEDPPPTKKKQQTNKQAKTKQTNTKITATYTDHLQIILLEITV